MVFVRTITSLTGSLVLSLCAASAALAELPLPPTPPASIPSETLLRSLHSDALQQIVEETLARNPEIARAEQLATAARLRAPQLGVLPDPTVALTAFALPPETRVGPQRFSVSIQQKFPGWGKLGLEEQAAFYSAAAQDAELETLRLDKLTETRRHAYELAFLEAQEHALSAERETLIRYEEVAQARYAAGTGRQQEILRIQAQITRTDTQLLEISEHRSRLGASLNQLRDRPADTPTGGLSLPNLDPFPLDRELLKLEAQDHRPELRAAEAVIAARRTHVELAEKRFRPDWTLGLSYTAVGRREDGPGRETPPSDNGDDIVALTGSINLPLRRRNLELGVDQAHAHRLAAEEAKRGIVAEIEGTVGDLTSRIPLLTQHLELLEGVLFKQARAALRSTETAYSTGELNAVDLLDAEVVLFEVQIATARTRADLAIALAELERAIAHPLRDISREPTS